MPPGGDRRISSEGLRNASTQQDFREATNRKLLFI